MNAAEDGAERLDVMLQAVSGQAIPVYRGEILRINQVEGGQRVDFNCFNLLDYKEYMSVGHMRREGFHASVGRLIWSNPPRYRPMMKIVTMSPMCVADLLAPRCSSVPVEVQFGIVDHPNCQDTLASAIGAYGLTPDDTHDPLNFWTNSAWDHVGSYAIDNTGAAGDHVDLLALMDVLAVTAICGSGNMTAVSNFSYKPIEIQVLEATSNNLRLAETEWRTHCSLRTQRTPDDLRCQPIRTHPELRSELSYVPSFLNWPIEWKSIELNFTSDEMQKIRLYRGKLGATDEEVVRSLFFHWYIEHRKRHGLRFYAPAQVLA